MISSSCLDQPSDKTCWADPQLPPRRRRQFIEEDKIEGNEKRFLEKFRS
jgi:hypothetical protein